MDAEAHATSEPPDPHDDRAPVPVDAPPVPPLQWRRAPTQLADRLGVRPASVVGGALAMVAASATAWWALRPPPPPPEETLPLVGSVVVAGAEPSGTAGGSGGAGDVTASPAPPAAEEVVLVVHVDGEVAVPGVHEVRGGARVIDAVDAAGGLLPDADRARVNLAQVLADGQRIWIPAVGDDEAPQTVTGGGAVVRSPVGASPAGGLAEPVSLSSADGPTLETLPGIGPSLAAAIIEYREREGAFTGVDELLGVSGIGPAKLDSIRDLVVP